MANVKITDLNAYTDPASTDVLPIVDVVTDETKKVSIADLMENAGTGSEVAPSIAFDGDANTGIYRPGADQIAISTGGTKRLEISATGAVTIPGNLTAAAFIPSGSSVPTNGVYLPSSNNVAISTNSTGRLFIDSSGRLGVGTSNPQGTLNVQGSTAAPSLTYDTANLVNLDAGTIQLAIGVNSSAPFGAYLQGRDSSNGARVISLNPAGGNVGIGTTSPSKQLSIRTSSADVGITLGAGANAYNQDIDFLNSVDSLSGRIRYYPDSGFMSFWTSATERVRIDSSGRVGIGTTSPAESFTVGTGNAQITSGQLTVGVTGTSGLQFINNGVFGTLDSNPLILRTASDEKARIDTSGRLLVGTSTSSKAYKVVVRNDAGNAGYEGGIFLQRASTPPGGGGHGLGTIAFGAAPTGDENDSARIVAKSDGDWGVNDWPTRLEFYTTSDGSNTPTERMRIDSSGRVGIGTASPGGKLVISDGSTTFQFDPVGGTGNILRSLTSGGSRDALLFDASQYVYSNGATEYARIDSSGRLLVGTTTARNLGSIGTSKFVIEGTGYNSSSVAFVNNENSPQPPYFILGKSRGGSVGSSTVVQSGDSIGQIVFAGADGTDLDSRAAEILCAVDGTPGANDMPGRLVFSTTADGASNPTERMSIRNTGEVRIESNLWNKGAIYLGPSGQDSSRFYTSSTGGSSTTMYIGNAAIQVSSDARLKENIEDTNLDALNAISKIKVKDFTWNDPSDASPNNRNARGTWTGLIAQELVEVLPFVVNAPRNENDGSIDYDSEDIWTLDQSQLCPVLIKAVQQQQEIIASLEARLSALEAQ